ncbi:hypothetical protein PR202_gb16066 [Eleusine coracana subsp. coracana]|uniref:Uncharacterized protein n=1 Tax=Eleusine coracana subsp. coracana TaxID=191504 RepID=A0AAV5F0W5_ELECO|nr:hypothetical protein PR202_gb16066 [Eleusine coracana subsp. coracana]
MYKLPIHPPYRPSNCRFHGSPRSSENAHPSPLHAVAAEDFEKQQGIAAASYNESARSRKPSLPWRNAEEPQPVAACFRGSPRIHSPSPRAPADRPGATDRLSCRQSSRSTRQSMPTIEHSIVTAAARAELVLANETGTILILR